MLSNALKQAIDIVKAGGIVIFPTDTAFGIGCRIDDEQAIKRLFTIRKRPETQATPVLVASFAMAKRYLQPLPSGIQKLMKNYWPGGLTIVYPCKKENVPTLVRGGGETLGVRMPNHRELLVIIDRVGVPILGPSANFHGQPTPFRSADLDSSLVRLVDYVLAGKVKYYQASTVIHCSQQPWKIIRQGVVKLDFQAKNQPPTTTLIIDTSDQKTITVGLRIADQIHTFNYPATHGASENLLPLIEKALNQHNIKLQEISSIEMAPGPGSFTGLRVGTAVANVLAFLLKIPVNGSLHPQEPVY
ncbi:threonylcarbamoyl-AMP synthase [Candidatus Woesebacteria bacterium]|nr:threonylcarbamoyl-AMP synthase [Candidatus Woesebacteria bacterium]